MTDTLLASARAQRRPTNVTLPEALQREAKELKVNVSQACEKGLTMAVAEAKRRLWLEQNRHAIAAYNAHVVLQEPALAAYRQF